MEKTNKAIKVIIKENTFEIKNDSPSFEEIVKYVVKNQNLDLKKDLSVISDDYPDFDNEIFKTTLIESLEATLESIKIDKDKYDELMKKIV